MGKPILLLIFELRPFRFKVYSFVIDQLLFIALDIESFDVKVPLIFKVFLGLGSKRLQLGWTTKMNSLFFIDKVGRSLMSGYDLGT